VDPSAGFSLTDLQVMLKSSLELLKQAILPAVLPIIEQFRKDDIVSLSATIDRM